MKIKQEATKFHEFNAHFKYKDLFNELLKIKTEQEKNINIINDTNKANSKEITYNELANVNFQSRNIEINNYINNLKLIEDKDENNDNKANSKTNKTYMNKFKDNSTKISNPKSNNNKKDMNQRAKNNLRDIYKDDKSKEDKLPSNIVLSNSIKNIKKDLKNQNKNMNIVNVIFIKKKSNMENKKTQKSKCFAKYKNSDRGFKSLNLNNKSYNKMLINNNIQHQLKEILKYRSISRRTKSKTKSKSNKKVSNKNDIKNYYKNSVKRINNNRINNSGINIRNKLTINLKQNLQNSSHNQKKSFSTSITKKYNKNRSKLNNNIILQKNNRIIKSNSNKHKNSNDLYKKNIKGNNLICDYSKNLFFKNKNVNNKRNKLQTRKSIKFNSSNNSSSQKFNINKEYNRTSKQKSTSSDKNHRNKNSNAKSNSKGKNILGISGDGGKTFINKVVCDYDGSNFSNRIAYLGNGKLALSAGNNGLYIVSNYGEKIKKVENVKYCKTVGFGAPEQKGDSNTLYMYGKPLNTDPEGLYRSQDEGNSWVLLNHEKLYGGTGNGNFVVGDMNTFGTFYMSSLGCGIIYGKIK